VYINIIIKILSIMKFKKILTAITLLICTLGTMSTVNADFNDGWVAYTSGDFKTASKQWRLLAEKGDAKSQTNLGILYFNGKGVLKDYKQAVRLFKMAGDQGEAEAQFILGKIYIEGDGVPRSLRNAKYWINLAFENEFDGAEALWNDYELWKY
jgi:TPR repeat protein